ncbi:MAG: hypothetical protein L0Z50_43470 [Verrucomicrobiales bacterium]|nr:hypothetical protein [Verrucomicrobiales bacterium]
MKSLITSLQRAFSYWRMKLASVALIGTVALFCLAAASGPHPERGLVGSWEVTVTPGDGSAPFQSLLTYGSDGVLTGVDGSLPPSLVTPNHGAWTRTGGHTFRFTFVEFAFDLDGSIFGSPGIYTVRISETLTFERGGQAYNGVWTGKIIGPAGPFDIGGTSHAERIVVEE